MDHDPPFGCQIEEDPTDFDLWIRVGGEGLVGALGGDQFADLLALGLLDLLVGSEQLEDGAGVVLGASQNHGRFAAVVPDDLRDVGGGAHMEAMEAWDGDLDFGDFRVVA